MTNDAFVLVAGSDSVRGYSLDDGTELWEAALPADCPGIAGWFGIDQATPSGVVVPCGGGWIPSSASQGGFAFLDTRRGEFTWTDVRDGLVGDTLSPPDVSPDGLLVRVRFWEHGANSGLAVADAILDVETGASLAEAERILGRLGYGGTVLHTGEITASARVRFENLRTGQQASMDVPCTVANPVVALSGGVLWLKFNRVIGEEPGDDPCQFVFTDAATGWTSAFSVEFEFTRQPQVVVRAGTIMFADGMTVFGLR